MDFQRTKPIHFSRMFKRAVHQPRIIPQTGPRRFVADAVALLVYLIVVYAASLTLHPLGRDYAALADPASLPPLAGRLFAWAIAAFGASPLGYHIVNLALLYGCMLALYRFVRISIPGPFWLGTLSAALFMANPVHSEAVLNLSGVGDLVPAFLALLALAVYARHVANPRLWSGIIAVAIFALAVLPYARNFPLVLVAALYQWLKWKRPTSENPAACTRAGGCPLCPTLLVPMAAITAAAGYLHPGLFRLENLDPARMFTPLYLIFYPIGLLPQTAYTFHQHQWLGWVAAATVVFIVALIYKKARRPVIFFGLVSMAAMRLFQGGHFIDPVHMLGGGALLVPNALFNIALVALFYRIADHPKWHRPIIMMTTLLAVVFFALQIAAIGQWRHAARVVRQFQTDAAQAAAPVGVLPDYRAYRAAPVALSESVSFDTPFSRRIENVSLLRLDYGPVSELDVEVTEWLPFAITCRVNAAPLVSAAPWPFWLLDAGSRVRAPGAAVEVREVEPGAALLHIRPDVAPETLLPATAPKRMAMLTTAVALATLLPSSVESEKGPEMKLTPQQLSLLDQAGWQHRAGDGPAVWVSIAEQMFRIIQKGAVLWQAPCSTAKKGPGFKLNSYKTPLGWHSVAEKIGDGAPWGQVFREKRPMRHVWKPGETTTTKEDLVLTRILALEGEEPGINKGGDVDSYARHIYIHGTNDEDSIGKPVSHGCIRLKNDDVIEAFERIPEATPVLITE